MMEDSPAKANLRAVVNQIKHSVPGYTLMTNDELAYLRKTAQAWLEKHPDNIEALKRYDRLVEEIKRRHATVTARSAYPATSSGRSPES